MSGFDSNVFEDQEYSQLKEEYVVNKVIKSENVRDLQGLFLIQTDSSTSPQVPTSDDQMSSNSNNPEMTMNLQRAPHPRVKL